MVRPETILVTGAGGFVGSALLSVLAQRGHRVRPVFRRSPMQGDGRGGVYQESCCLDITSEEGNWRQALDNVDVVIHLAGLAHVDLRGSVKGVSAFRRVNVEATMRLAQNAASCGVKRFVYVSSAKVHGDCSPAEKPFREVDTPNPGDAYAISKWEAEQALRELEIGTDMQVVVIRPPLIYGPGVKANFLRLLKAVHKGLPLPVAGVNNRRSLAALDNVVDAIAVCATHEKAGGETFLVADGEDLSTPELVERLSHAMGKRAMLFSVSPFLARAVLTMCGKQAAYDRLWGSFVVESEKIRRLLTWRPPVSVDNGIQQTVNWYLHAKR